MGIIDRIISWFESRDGRRPIDDAIDKITESLVNSPEDWKLRDYGTHSAGLVHPETGVEVDCFMSHYAYTHQVTIDGHRYGTEDMGRDARRRVDRASNDVERRKKEQSTVARVALHMGKVPSA